jgi:hypothetical protein
VHQALGAQVVPIEHPARGGAADRVRRGQVRAGERERRSQGAGVEGAAHPDQVQTHRQRRNPALQAAVSGGLGIQQQARGQRPDRADLVSQPALCGGVDRDVQPEAEQFALAAGHPGGQVVGVLGGRLHLWVEQSAVVGGVPAAAFQLGQLSLQPARGGDRVGRLDVQGHVQPTGVGQQRRQPPGMDFAGIAGDRERGHPLGCDL